MATHLRVSAVILWFAFALSALSICRGAVSDISTQDFFNGIISAAGEGCAGMTFYTYGDFINAANSFSSFGTTGTSDDNKKEIAAFFANVAHETGNLCYVEQINENDYCDSTQYPCATGQQYYGRGPLQLSWNYNYGAAGDYLGQDLLDNPDTVVQDDVTSWKTALWFWNVNSNGHTAITSDQGFGATIQALNGDAECNGGNPEGVNDRISYYISYCNQFGVDPGSNLSC